PKESKNPYGRFMVKSMLECSNQSDAMKKLGQNFDVERRKAFISRFQKAQDSVELHKTQIQKPWPSISQAYPLLFQ
ncbi:MAG: hypothetical protein N2B02_04385, partial [Amylibacter sp.]